MYSWAEMKVTDCCTLTCIIFSLEFKFPIDHQYHQPCVKGFGARSPSQLAHSGTARQSKPESAPQRCCSDFFSPRWPTGAEGNLAARLWRHAKLQRSLASLIGCSVGARTCAGNTTYLQTRLFAMLHVSGGFFFGNCVSFISEIFEFIIYQNDI